MTKCRGEREIKGANQNIKTTKYPSDHTTNINWLFTPRLGDFIYFHLWNSLQAMNLSEQGGWEGQGCPWQQRVSCFYIQGQHGTSDTTWIHDCDTGTCTGKFCCPAEKKSDAAIKKRNRHAGIWIKESNDNKSILFYSILFSRWETLHKSGVENKGLTSITEKWRSFCSEFTSMTGLTFFGQY